MNSLISIIFQLFNALFWYWNQLWLLTVVLFSSTTSQHCSSIRKAKKDLGILFSRIIYSTFVIFSQRGAESRFAVVYFGSSPTLSPPSPVSKLDRNNGKETGTAGRGRGRSQIIRLHESLVLYESFNTLCPTLFRLFHRTTDRGRGGGGTMVHS